jgi:hypothetical protein
MARSSPYSGGGVMTDFLINAHYLLEMDAKRKARIHAAEKVQQ